MVKQKAIYACQQCSAQFPKWQGQCPDCGRWNTLVEEVVVNAPAGRVANYAGASSTVTALGDIDCVDLKRLSTDFKELDHVLGGGLVEGSVVLIGGDPGIGKSTLLLQVLGTLAQAVKPLYVTGEESLQQVAMRAKRLGIHNDALKLCAETNVNRIIKMADAESPGVMVIDSIQTIYTDDVSSAPGGVSQVRESTARLVQYAKQKNVILLIVGHVTKEGALAGPRVLEHMVDAVLYFEGSQDSRFRLIRAVKNRYGAVNELGVFAMSDTGLKAVTNPSAIFLSKQAASPGSVVMVTWEGTRPLLVEVQVLVDTSHLPNPKRVTVGIDHQRLSMLLAVLHRHAGIATYDQDVFVNVVGGLRIHETGIDLAVVLSVISSLQNRALPRQLCVYGEVGLAGEVRPVQSGQSRLQEAIKQGYTHIILPKGNTPKQSPAGVELLAVQSLSDAVRAVTELCHSKKSSSEALA